MFRKIVRPVMAALVVGGLSTVASAGSVQYTARLDTLNAAFGSNASGTASLTLNNDDPNMPSLRVQMHVTGMQDLSGTGAVHVAHIHGQFAGNADRPLADEGNGPFFAGTGGTAVNSRVPDLSDDGRLIKDGLIDFFEGLPKYGPVIENLSSTQLRSPASGVAPLSDFFAQAGAGTINPAALFPTGTVFDRDTTYRFDLSDADQARQYHNLLPLDDREIVVHGLTVPTSISDAIDAATGTEVGTPTHGIDLGDGTSFRSTAPIAAGEIVRGGATAIPLPPAAWTGLAMLGALGLVQATRMRLRVVQ